MLNPNPKEMLVEHLLASKADVNGAKQDGTTSLVMAAHKG